MTIIEQIKAEIERRIRELDEQIVDIYDSKAVLRKDELQRLLSFLSTLEESEKPMNLGELGEEIQRFLSNATKMDKGEWKGKYPICKMGFSVVARHFAQWGAERQKEQDRLEIANIKAKLWQDGFDDCRKQMLKDAVEYEVWNFSSSLEAYPHVNIPLDNKQCRIGDKVRIIIVKED